MSDDKAMPEAAAQAVQARGYSWRNAVRGNVLMMGLVSLFTDFSSEMMNPLLPVYITGLVAALGLDAGWVAIFVGLTEGVAETTASLLKLFSGRISDKLGKRKSLVAWGYGISTIARPAMALAIYPAQVVFLKFLDRVGKGIRTSPRDALIGDSVGPEVRGLAFSFHRAMDHAGAVLGSVASIGVLTAMLGYAIWRHSTGVPSDAEMRALRWVFGLAIVPGVLAMLTLLGGVREIAPKPAAAKVGPNLSAWRQGAPTATRRGWGPRLDRRFYQYVAVVTLFYLGNSSDMFLLLLAYERFGMSLLALIGLWVVLHLSKIVFSFVGGYLSDHMGRRPLIVGGWLVYALVYLGFAFVTRQWQFWALFLIYGVYYGMTEGVEKALVADFVPSEHRGTAFGIYHGAIGIAALPSNLLIFGIFWKVLGPKVAFGIGGGLALAAAVLMVALLSRTSSARTA